MWGAQNERTDRNREHACETAVDGFVHVDVAQSVPQRREAKWGPLACTGTLGGYSC